MKVPQQKELQFVFVQGTGFVRELLLLHEDRHVATRPVSLLAVAYR